MPVCNSPRASRRLHIKAGQRASSSAPASGVTQRYQQDPYAVWDVSLAREAGRIHPYLQMTNLTNTAYQEIAGVPMPGRAFTGGIELVLTKAPR